MNIIRTMFYCACIWLGWWVAQPLIMRDKFHDSLFLQAHWMDEFWFRAVVALAFALVAGTIGWAYDNRHDPELWEWFSADKPRGSYAVDVVMAMDERGQK